MSDAHIVNLLSQEGIALLEKKRNETIEECARKLEWLIDQEDKEVSQWPAELRALKDK